MTAFLAVRIDAELKAKLEKIAKEEDRSLSNVVVRLLREALAKEKRDQRK